jgi:hypothetical protein
MCVAGPCVCSAFLCPGGCAALAEFIREDDSLLTVLLPLFTAPTGLLGTVTLRFVLQALCTRCNGL